MNTMEWPNKGDMNSMVKLLLDLTIVGVIFFGAAETLSTSTTDIIANTGATFAGVWALLYFRRGKEGDPAAYASYSELAFKGGVSATFGYIFGAAATQYFAIESNAYRALVYSISGLGSIAMLKALVVALEQNAMAWVLTIFQRGGIPEQKAIVAERMTKDEAIEAVMDGDTTKKKDGK